MEWSVGQFVLPLYWNDMRIAHICNSAPLLPTSFAYALLKSYSLLWNYSVSMHTKPNKED